MAPRRYHGLKQTFRGALLAAATVTGFALIPTASARVNVGFDVNIALPPGVHVNVSNYEPYYVGRVFYQPLAVWRPIYSFPVETPYGVVYEPFVYDQGRVVCREYIPGAAYGYGQFVIEGHGHYDPAWRRPAYVAHNSYYGARAYRDSRDWRSSPDRHQSWDRGDDRRDGGSDSHGRKNGHSKHGR